MSKRFGRNQKRRMRQEIAELDALAKRLQQSANNGSFNTRVLLDECMQAIDVFKRIGWKEDCDVIRRMEHAFTQLQGHYVADIYKKKFVEKAADDFFMNGNKKPGEKGPIGLNIRGSL